MEIEKVTKIAFFTGYNYSLRYFNIKRKYEDLRNNAERLQTIINEEHKPFIFKGGELVKNGKKIFDVTKIQATMKTKEPKQGSFTKKFTSIPYTEQALHYLMVDIILEATQYCADLASVILGLKDFRSSKSTYSQIEDVRIKKWYRDYEKPSLEEFLDIFDLPPFYKLTPEERFNISLKYDELKWNLNKIGKFYWYNYDYLYTPIRHGMKGTFFKDEKNHVFFKTLTKDKKWNLYYLSESRINECLQISELIYIVFNNYLQEILFSRGLSPLFKSIRIKVLKGPTLPVESFDPTLITIKFIDLPEIIVHHFTTNDISSLHQFANNPQNNIDYKYIKNINGISLFKLDGTPYYLDELFSFSKKLSEKIYLIITNSPFAYFVELMYISLKIKPLDKVLFEQVGDSIFNYLAVEKNIDYVLEDPSKIIHRTNQLKAITDKLVEDVVILTGLNYYKETIDNSQFNDKELIYFCYIYEKKIIRFLNMKGLFSDSSPDIILQVLVDILIINSMMGPKSIMKYADALKLKNLEPVLTKCVYLISKSTQEGLNLEFLLLLLDFLYDTTSSLE